MLAVLRFCSSAFPQPTYPISPTFPMAKTRYKSWWTQTFSNVNLDSPVKKQKALYSPPTGCSPNLCCFILTHILAYISREALKCCFLGNVLLLLYMLFVFTSTQEKKLSPIFQVAHVIQHFCKHAGKHPALAKINIHSAKIFAEVKVS